MQSLYDIYLKHPEISTDTRSIIPDSIFFSLKGDQFDGNKFAEDALEKGSAFAVIDNPLYKKDERYILVDDSLLALQNLAQTHRENLDISVIGITGTNGKTTTKELIAAILKKKYKTHVTEGNFNNHIGVPLTLLSIKSDIEIAVIEMGASHIGEIKLLCRLAMPNYGLITNIGKAHLQGFGNFDGVLKAKNELYEYISKTKGKIFLNADNDILRNIANGLSAITYGTDKNAACCGMITESTPYLHIKWKSGAETSWHNIFSQITGIYNFENIMSAICIGDYFQVSHSDICSAINGFVPTNNRSQLIERKGYSIIKDAYNANPVSMKAAIMNLSEQHVPNKIAILGDMLELGSFSKKEHGRIIKLLESQSFNKVYLVGSLFKNAINNNPYTTFETVEDLIRFFSTKSNKFPENSIVLLKGSRGISLEKVLSVI